MSKYDWRAQHAGMPRDVRQAASLNTADRGTWVWQKAFSAALPQQALLKAGRQASPKRAHVHEEQGCGALAARMNGWPPAAQQ